MIHRFLEISVLIILPWKHFCLKNMWVKSMCVQVSLVAPLLGAARQRRDPTVAQVAAGPSHRWSRSVIKCTCWVISRAEFLLTQSEASIVAREKGTWRYLLKRCLLKRCPITCFNIWILKNIFLLNISVIVCLYVHTVSLGSTLYKVYKIISLFNVGPLMIFYIFYL